MRLRIQLILEIVGSAIPADSDVSRFLLMTNCHLWLLFNGFHGKNGRPGFLLIRVFIIFHNNMHGLCFLAQVCGCYGYVYAPLAQDKEVKKPDPAPTPTNKAGGGGASDQTRDVMRKMWTKISRRWWLPQAPERKEKAEGEESDEKERVWEVHW